MTGRTAANKKSKYAPIVEALEAESARRPAVPLTATTFDIGELSGQLGRIGGVLEQLQADNQVLSDALADTNRKLDEARSAENVAQKVISEGKVKAARIQATVDRRDAEIIQIEAELSKIRSERTDWESVILAERDAAIEEQTADLAAARADVRALGDRIAALEDELALERQRTAPDTHLVQLMTTAGTTLLIDGEDLVHTGWPHLAPERRRGHVIDAAARFHQRHGVDIEVLFAGAEGWDPADPAPAGVRIRVPHEGILISACLARLARAYGLSATPVVTVSSAAASEPWIATTRAAALMGLPSPSDLTNDQVFELATEEEK